MKTQIAGNNGKTERVAQRELQETEQLTVSIDAAGGAGGKIASSIAEELEGITFKRTTLKIQALNTDVEDLRKTHDSINIIQIGPKITGGGAGNDPKQGRLAAEESKKEIKNAVESGDLKFFIGSVAKGTSTALLPKMAEDFIKHSESIKEEPIHKRKAGIAIVILPFKREGLIREQRAAEGIDQLQQTRLPLIIIPNDKLLPETPDKNRSVHKMFADGNKPIAHVIARMTKSLGEPHDLENIDWNDISGMARKSYEVDGYSSQAFMSYGSAGKGADRVTKALEEAKTNSYLNTSLKYCKGAIISIHIDDPTEDEYAAILEFQKTECYYPDADWRIGLNGSVDLLPFEEEDEPEVVVCILGFGYMPVVSAEDTPIEKPLESFEQDVNGLKAIESMKANSPDLVQINANGNGNGSKDDSKTEVPVAAPTETPSGSENLEQSLPNAVPEKVEEAQQVETAGASNGNPTTQPKAKSIEINSVLKLATIGDASKGEPLNQTTKIEEK